MLEVILESIICCIVVNSQVIGKQLRTKRKIRERIGKWIKEYKKRVLFSYHITNTSFIAKVKLDDSLVHWRHLCLQNICIYNSKLYCKSSNFKNIKIYNSLCFNCSLPKLEDLNFELFNKIDAIFLILTIIAVWN